MDLNTYLAKHKIRRKDFAYDLGINTSYLYQIIGGSAKCSRMLATFIEWLTDGEVTYFNMMGKHKPRKEKDKDAT